MANPSNTFDLFNLSDDETADSPLADRMRPRTLDEIVGQEEPLSEGGFLREAVANDRVPSLIFWGPPGCGKTTLACVIANRTEAVFEPFSAVLGGIKEVRIIVARAKTRRASGRRTILFVDEIHRFNKAQQDGFLPHVERGVVTLIGATTENPGFSINNALLSRCRVVKLEPLGAPALEKLLTRALDDQERGLGELELKADPRFIRLVADVADGDARRALNLLEQAAQHAIHLETKELEPALLKTVLERAPHRYDRQGDAHYDTVSAFIKSMRGSDPDAALYYAARMLDSGEDPLFLLRRVLIFASEDVGNADPRALQVALAAHQAFERLGLPEGVLPLAQAITYCATAPKSNASYNAWNEAKKDVQTTGSLEIPLHLRNAPIELMKQLGHGKGYQYPHDHTGHFVDERYLPDELENRHYYQPTGQGYERYIVQRLEQWRGKKPK